jgi:hypothetical protein
MLHYSVARYFLAQLDWAIGVRRASGNDLEHEPGLRAKTGERRCLGARLGLNRAPLLESAAGVVAIVSDDDACVFYGLISRLRENEKRATQDLLVRQSCAARGGAVTQP